MRLKPRPGSLDPHLDARLVRRCRAGDSRAWEALVRRHERLVYAVARSYRLPDSDLEDVFQEVFAALVRGLPRIREARSLCRWLSSTTERIAAAAALRHRRDQAQCARESVWIEELESDQLPVGADLEELEEQAMVRLAVTSLPEGCRRLVSALFYESPPPSYAELSHRLGVPIGSLGPNRARCLEQLRRIVLDLSSEEKRIRLDRRSTSPCLGPRVRPVSKSLRARVVVEPRIQPYPDPPDQAYPARGLGPRPGVGEESAS